MNLKTILGIIIFVMPIVLSMNSMSNGSCSKLRTSLSSVRKRRHLAFPPGSSASIIASVVKTFMTHVPSGWYFVIELEVTYPLPEAEIIASSLRRKLHNRQKRQAWQLLQNTIDGHHINGRACIIRTICEAQSHLATKGKSLVHDILRTLFTVPLHDDEFLEEVGDTYNEILQPNFCEKEIDCPFSILTFLLDFNNEKKYNFK